MQPSSPAVQVITQMPTLPARPADSNKGMFGRVLVVAGSRGMSGAAVLCASAALRGGAVLVRLAVPEGILPLVAPAITGGALLAAIDSLALFGPQASGFRRSLEFAVVLFLKPVIRSLEPALTDWHRG